VFQKQSKEGLLAALMLGLLFYIPEVVFRYREEGGLMK